MDNKVAWNKLVFNANSIPDAIVGASAGKVLSGVVPHDAKSLLVPVLAAVFGAVVNVMRGAKVRSSIAPDCTP